MANNRRPEDDYNNAPSLEEQMVRRQSAPQPTAESYLMDRMAMLPAVQSGAIDGFQALNHQIGVEEIREATQILQRYKAGKANLDNRIVSNEQWYKLRHWEMIEHRPNMVEPTSAWLFNSLENKHADAMDNFPSPNILPREEMDKPEAKMLSSIIPVILEQNDFEETYSDAWMYKLKSGTGCYGVFWDRDKLNGLGDISIVPIDIVQLFFQPGIKDIQKSKHLFHVELADNDSLIQAYPQLANKLGTSTVDTAQYIYDDSIQTEDKSAVVDWYYKKLNSQGKQVLHYCKYVNDYILYASENDPEYAERGFYDHGLYPFVLDPLFKVEGSPCGFGYIDIGKYSQEYIDRGNQAIMQNMLANARPRHFIRSDGSVNEAEYADQTNDFIHVDGNLGQDSILPIQGKPLNDIYVQVINNKIDELKETTGNRDIATGGTTSGVTAASAISAMQEAASKLSRKNIKASYRQYRKIILMVIELIRQFYDQPRCFRIMGERNAEEYVYYSNANIKPQWQAIEMGVDMGYRQPLFDIEVTAEKQSPYSRMSQNELALQFYSAGFFIPDNADQALACLDMMDFDRKQFVEEKIEQNGTMFQQIIQLQQQAIMLAQMVDASKGTNLAQQLAAQFSGQQMMMGQPTGKAELPESKSDESKVTQKARQRVAESTSPT